MTAARKRNDSSWIFEYGRSAGRGSGRPDKRGRWGVDREGGAGAGVHHDGTGDGGRTVGPRVLVGAREVERGEEGGDLGGFCDDREGAELARAERVLKRIEAPDVFD